MEQPASVMRVQKAIEGMVEDIQRSYLIPQQKEAFLCCARCCDQHQDTQGLQRCVEQCSMPSVQKQKVIQQVMQDFQERFQRCALRCQDMAREIGGFDPSAADEAKAKAKFNSCMDECGKEFEGKVPKLKSDIIAQMKKI